MVRQLILGIVLGLSGPGLAEISGTAPPSPRVERIVFSEDGQHLSVLYELNASANPASNTPRSICWDLKLGSSVPHGACGCTFAPAQDVPDSPSPRRARSERVYPLQAGPTVTDPTDALLAIPGWDGSVRLWDRLTGALQHVAYPDGRLDRTVTVAAIQCPAVFGDPATNAAQMLDLARSAASRGAAIIVFPEAALTGYLTSDASTTWQVEDRELGEDLRGCDPSGSARSVNDAIFHPFIDLAAECGVYLSIPFLEVDRRTGRYYNSVLLFGPTGERLIHYRKRNPWPWAEQSWATEGNLGNPIVDTPFGRLGCLICYDIHEQAAVMGELKIDTLLYSIAWVDEARSDWFDTQLPAIAAAHDFNIIAANWSMPLSTSVNWHGYGQSRVIDRSGKILCRTETDQGPSIVLADLPLPPLEVGPTLP